MVEIRADGHKSVVLCGIEMCRNDPANIFAIKRLLGGGDILEVAHQRGQNVVRRGDSRQGRSANRRRRLTDFLTRASFNPSLYYNILWALALEYDTFSTTFT